MNIYTFKFRVSYFTGIYQVISKTEDQARGMLLNDGHTTAQHTDYFRLESVYKLNKKEHYKESILYVLELDTEESI